MFQEPPFLDYSEDSSTEGNEHYVGYIPDVMKSVLPNMFQEPPFLDYSGDINAEGNGHGNAKWTLLSLTWRLVGLLNSMFSSKNEKNNEKSIVFYNTTKSSEQLQQSRFESDFKR